MIDGNLKLSGPSRVLRGGRAAALQSWSRLQIRQGEFARLWPVGIAQSKSGKLMSQPGGEEACRDGGAFAPRCEFGQREGLKQSEGQQLGERVGSRTDLHPQLQRRFGLLPQMVGAPPAFEIVKERL